MSDFLPIVKFSPNLIYRSDCKVVLSQKALGRKVAIEIQNYDSSSDEEEGSLEEKKEKPKEVIYEQIVTQEDLDWFYKSDVMPSPDFFDPNVVDMHQYYQKGAPEPSPLEAQIKASLKNRFEQNRHHKAILSKTLEIADVNENDFFFNS
jgi:hypothetical protein